MLKNNIKVGDYVRTKYGISKVEEDRRIHFGLMHPVIDILKQEVIIKSSPNIIDLIEEGDYVNGDRVKALKGDIESHKINNEEDVIYTEYINDYDEWCGYEEDEIKSIVTKEQFESMEYKIER